MSTFKMGPEWREPIGELSCFLSIFIFDLFFQWWPEMKAYYADSGEK